MGMGWEGIRLVKISRVGVLLFQRLKGKLEEIDLTNNYKTTSPIAQHSETFSKAALLYAWCADVERIIRQAKDKT